MGWYYYVTCRNKAWRYSVKIYGGEPARLFHEAERLKEEILTGKKDASEKIKRVVEIRRTNSNQSCLFVPQMS